MHTKSNPPASVVAICGGNIMDKVAHCLFEQSGTFKNEFKKLGFNALINPQYANRFIREFIL